MFSELVSLSITLGCNHLDLLTRPVLANNSQGSSQLDLLLRSVSDTRVKGSKDSLVFVFYPRVESKFFVRRSDVSKADYVAGSFYCYLRLKILASTAFCNSLETFQVVSSIFEVTPSLTVISKDNEIVVKVFNSTKACIKSVQLLSQFPCTLRQYVRGSTHGCSSLVRSMVRERLLCWSSRIQRWSFGETSRGEYNSQFRHLKALLRSFVAHSGMN